MQIDSPRSSIAWASGQSNGLLKKPELLERNPPMRLTRGVNPVSFHVKRIREKAGFSSYSADVKAILLWRHIDWGVFHGDDSAIFTSEEHPNLS